MSSRPPMIAPERYLHDIESRWPGLDQTIETAKSLMCKGIDARGVRRQAPFDWVGIVAANQAYAGGFLPETAVRADGSIDPSALPPGGLGLCLDAAEAAETATSFDDTVLYDMWPSWKVVYRFDPDLAEELMESRWAAGTPCSDFEKLPAGCFYVQAPMTVTANLGSAKREGIGRFSGGTPMVCDGFFVWVCPIWIERAGKREIVKNLCMRFVTRRGLSAGMLSASLDLGELEDAIAEDVSYFTPPGTDPGSDAVRAFSDHQTDLARRACSLLLYLASVQTDVRSGGKTKRQRKAPRSKHVGEVELVDVGLAIGSAIRAYRDEKGGSGGSGGSMRPHVRRGHFHHYWIGSRADPERVLKWIHPVIVKGGKGKPTATIHEVLG